MVEIDRVATDVCDQQVGKPVLVPARGANTLGISSSDHLVLRRTARLYPNAKGKKYWRLVMSLYQKMRGKTSESDLDKAIAGNAG